MTETALMAPDSQTAPSSASALALQAPSSASALALQAPAADPAVWNAVLGLPCHLTVELAVPGFQVADLLALEVESVVDTAWNQNAEVPLRVNGQIFGWAEFEVVSDRLAVRLTELA